MTSKTNKEKIVWRAAERQFHKKSFNWYLYLTLFFAALAALALIQKNFLFAFFLAATYTLLIHLTRHRPPILTFSLDDKGLKIGRDSFYPYEEMEWFALVEKPHRLNELVFKRKSHFVSYIRCQIDSELSLKAKEFLSNYLEFNEHYEPSLIDTFAEYIGLN